MSQLSNLTSALERSWSAIRQEHPDVRHAVIVVYLHQKGDRRGHYDKEAWTTREHAHLDEVHVSSHIIAEGGQSVLRTLLHEACHSVAFARGIKDTSRQGRYHNYRFAQLAYELGLITTQSDGAGYVTVEIKRETKDRFQAALADLDQSLDLWQGLDWRQQVGKLKKGKHAMEKWACPDCGRHVRASKKTTSQGPILCVPCGCVFEQVE